MGIKYGFWVHVLAYAIKYIDDDCSIIPRLVAASPVASWSAAKTSASSTGPPPDIPTVMVMGWPFEGNQLKEDVRWLLLGDATRVDLKGFDRDGPAAGKQ